MSELKGLCGNMQKSISTCLFDFQFCWSNATCSILQKIQPVEIEVATQTLKLRPPKKLRIKRWMGEFGDAERVFAGDFHAGTCARLPKTSDGWRVATMSVLNALWAIPFVL